MDIRKRNAAGDDEARRCGALFFVTLCLTYFRSFLSARAQLSEQPVKQRALGVIAFLVSAVVAAPALSHDCRVRDVAGYLRGVYEGDCDKSETAHGQGEAKGADTYVGTFVNGWPEGKGSYTWENGAHLEGTFKRGKAHGPGVYVSAKGVRYEGEFVDGNLKALKPEDCPVTQGPLACGR